MLGPPLARVVLSLLPFGKFAFLRREGPMMVPTVPLSPRIGERGTMRHGGTGNSASASPPAVENLNIETAAPEMFCELKQNCIGTPTLIPRFFTTALKPKSVVAPIAPVTSLSDMKSPAEKSTVCVVSDAVVPLAAASVQVR